ncbi:DUF3164 family protein [Neptunicella sp. SCSIO 80796]|uniref:DUF3164 family protein n=1 Tax=Neptunicella plasticusilytica TaxID=3117012 RepID=UPI003A4D866C
MGITKLEQLHTLLDNTAPKGFMFDAEGNLMRRDKIKPQDFDRDVIVKDLFRDALLVSDEMRRLANKLQTRIAEFVSHSLAEYSKNIGGKKGNVTLYSFDRSIKIERSRQDKIAFNERLLAAKQIIDSCIKRWSKGSNKNLQAIVQGAFKTDKSGRFSAAKVLSLRQHKIDDSEWQSAMKALADAIEVDRTAEYFRVYYRIESGSYVQLPLDMANINNLGATQHD